MASVIPSGYVAVRDYVTGKGGQVGWNDNAKQLSINGKYVPLTAGNYVNVGGRIYMDPSRINSYLGGGSSSSSKSSSKKPSSTQNSAVGAVTSAMLGGLMPGGLAGAPAVGGGIATSLNNATKPKTATSQQSTPAVQQQPAAQTSSGPNNWSYYEKLLLDMLDDTPTYKTLSDDEMTTLANQYAGLQINPLLSGLTSQESKALTDSDSAKQAIEAAYSGLKDATTARLGEAHNSAVEDAVARGMGRSGVVNWTDAKLSAPIMQAEQQANAEKAAKISAVASSLANLQSDISRQRTDLEGRKGDLVAQQLANLRNQNTQMAANYQNQRMNQAMQIANLALQDKGIDQQALFNLLNQIIAG